MNGRNLLIVCVVVVISGYASADLIQSFESPDYALGALTAQSALWNASASDQIILGTAGTGTPDGGGDQLLQILDSTLRKTAYYNSPDEGTPGNTTMEVAFYGVSVGKALFVQSLTNGGRNAKTYINVNSTGTALLYSYYWNGTGMVTTTGLDVTSSYNTGGWNTIEHDFDFSGTTLDSYDVRLNGVLIQDDLAYENIAGNTHIFQVILANDNRTNIGRSAYYDNLSVVPEPATVLLLGLGATIFARKKDRK